MLAQEASGSGDLFTLCGVLIGRNHWRGRGSGPLNIFIEQLFSWVVGLALLHCNKVDYFKIYLSTIHQIK